MWLVPYLFEVKNYVKSIQEESSVLGSMETKTSCSKGARFANINKKTSKSEFLNKNIKKLFPSLGKVSHGHVATSSRLQF